MASYAIDESQRKAARVAGWMYLFTMMAANFAEFYVRGRILVQGDAVQTARNIAASAGLFRLGLASDLLMLAGEGVLVVALYVILKPVNRNLAMLAVFWRLVECSVAAVTVAGNIAALRLLSGADSPQALNSEQLQALARVLIGMDAGGNRVAALFFGLGSAAFCCLWFKSRYIPRVLSAWGILASLVPVFIPLATIVLSAFADAPLRRARTGSPIIIFEVVLGGWLLLKGIKEPVAR
jgi:hypothetical protein